MDKKMKKFLLADIFLLVFLFLLSSTDFLLRERKMDIIRIAVLTDMPAGRQLENFRIGVAKAAAEWNVDVSFSSLADMRTGEEKQAAVQRELETGCRGIVLQCRDSRHAEEALESVPVGVPVVLYDSETDSARVRVRIGGNAEEESRLLAEAVLTGREKGESVTIVEPVQKSWYMEQLHGLTEERLREAGVLVRRVSLGETSAVETLLKGMAAQGGNILVSGDISVLQALGEANTEGIPVYGAGFSGAVRGFLEKGTVRGTVVHRDYEAGYLAVEGAARILQGKGAAEETVVVESVLVTAETLRDKNVESVVFPYI